METIFRHTLVIFWLVASALLVTFVDKIIGFDASKLIPASILIHNVLQQIIGAVLVYILVGGYIKKRQDVSNSR